MLFKLDCFGKGQQPCTNVWPDTLSILVAELGLEPRKINPQSSARWKKTSNVAKAYLKAVVAFSETLTDTVMVHMLLRHAERMLPYMRPFPKVRAFLSNYFEIFVLMVFDGVGES